ncbi:MAG TPA: hypothetical protein QGG37_11415 [Chloroflexota bacterium]|nr:hypothetical protein [Chloroflexota bacterium]
MNRRLLVIPALLAVLIGIWAGLVRVGWDWPMPRGGWVPDHGPLLVSGFLGTVIGMERAVALDRRPAFIAPLLGAVGILTLVLGAPSPTAQILMIGAAIGMTAVNVLGPLSRGRFADHALVVISGSLMWLAGNVLWAFGFAGYQLTLFWIGFVALTIGGERLELSQFSRPGPRARVLFWVFAALLPLGAGLSAGGIWSGQRILGAGLVTLTLWLVRYDFARRIAGKAGLSRYMAFTLTSGYVWMFIAGASWLYHGNLVAGPIYDGAVHSFFLGFVIVMIFAHAPVIFAAMAGISEAFHPMLYAPVALMHGSLAARFLGDLFAEPGLRQWGALLNAVALVVFLVFMVRLAQRARPLA